MSNSNAVKRLSQDLTQLVKEPIIGANAAPLESDIMKWYGIVMGVEGTAYAGIPIHFVMEFDHNYPNSAPKAFFSHEIKYEGGASYKVDGRLAVCLNIFGNFHHVHTEWKNMQEGWSPSYTVSTILLTMQGLMMSDMLSTNPRDLDMTRKSALEYKCNVTGHDGSDPNKYFPKILMSQEEVEQYAKENGFTKEDKKYDIERDHYICYVKKITKKDGIILGYGVHLENARIGMLSSPCEYLSQDAFKEGARNSSTNKPFENWMPILTHSSDWNSVKPFFVESMKQIGSTIGYGKKPIHETVLKVCSSIMNTLVVEIMNNKNNLTANDKFVDGYFAVYRLMKQFANDEPAFLQFVDNELKRFVEQPNKRTKETVQNLGELLIFLTVSKKYDWNHIARFFLEESDTRNVFWYAVGNHNNPPRCPELLNKTIKTGRTQKVFNATEVSRNLIMYQVKFSQVAKALDFDTLDSNFGLAPLLLRTDLKSTYNDISKVTDWPGYFNWLQLKPVSDDERCEQLIEAINNSAKQAYHKDNGNVSQKSKANNFGYSKRY